VLLLVTQAMPQMRKHDHPNLGRLVTPRHFCSLHEHAGWPWAADNDCFQRLDPDAYFRDAGCAGWQARAVPVRDCARRRSGRARDGEAL
jgi:hypothetical protein